MDLRDQLRKAGLTNEAQASEGQGGEPTIPASTPQSVDFNKFPEWALRWAHAGMQLLGREQLVKALETATDGTNRSAGAFENRIERALDRLTVARANELRTDLFSLYRGKGCPTFCGNANTVSEAIVSGAYDAWLEHERDEASVAETLVIPKPEEGEDLHGYGERLDDWSADKPGALLKRIGFDAYQLVRNEQERREQAKAKVEGELKAQASSELKTGLAGSFPSAIEFLKGWVKKMGSLYKQGLVSYSASEELARAAVAASPWPWSLYVAWDALGYDERAGVSIYAPNTPPTTSDASNLTDRWLLWKVAKSRESVLRSEVSRRYPLSPSQVHLVKVQSSREKTVRYAVYSDGEVKELYSSSSFPGRPGVYPTESNVEGWWNRDADVWCTPNVYRALKRLEQAAKGAAFITPEVVSNYGRHPERGYPRFYFKVSAGRRWTSFDLPVWRPGEGDGWLVERLDDITLLTEHKLAVPEAAYWMDVQLGQTAKGNRRLEPVRSDQKATPAILTKRGEGAMSHGKWGWSNQTHSAVKGSEKGGSAIVWSTFVSSAGGGLHRTFDLLWVAKGGSVGLDNGVAVTFDGQRIVKVAGGALPLEDDPTR